MEALKKILFPPKSSGSISIYEVDIDIAPLITEIRIYADEHGNYHISEQYRSEVVYDPSLKGIATLLYSEGVMANDRIAAFLNAVSGEELGLSNGSIYHFCKSMAEKVAPSITRLEEELLNQNVVCTDATTVTVNAAQSYIRNFSTEETVLYCAMKKKALDAMHKSSFLETFAGTLVHDHETALYHFGTGHAECNVHIIRYLRKNTEDTGNEWSGGMIRLLSEMNRTRKSVMVQGWTAFPGDTVSSYEKRYRELIAQGREENKTTKHAYARRDETALLNPSSRLAKQRFVPQSKPCWKPQRQRRMERVSISLMLTCLERRNDDGRTTHSFSRGKVLEETEGQEAEKAPSGCHSSTIS